VSISGDLPGRRCNLPKKSSGSRMRKRIDRMTDLVKT